MLAKRFAETARSFAYDLQVIEHPDLKLGVGSKLARETLVSFRIWSMARRIRVSAQSRASQKDGFIQDLFSKILAQHAIHGDVDMRSDCLLHFH